MAGSAFPGYFVHPLLGYPHCILPFVVPFSADSKSTWCEQYNQCLVSVLSRNDRNNLLDWTSSGAGHHHVRHSRFVSAEKEKSCVTNITPYDP